MSVYEPQKRGTATAVVADGMCASVFLLQQVLNKNEVDNSLQQKYGFVKSEI